MSDASDRQDVVVRFREAASGPRLDLFTAALVISQLIDPGEDVAPAQEEVDRLAARVAAAQRAGEPPDGALRRILFSEEHFQGDGDSYDDPENSSVARVVARRKGMPITLSILVIEVGRRAGLNLTGVGLPGHFVVGGSDLPPGRFLDPFEGGELCDAEDLARRVSAIFGTPVELPPEVFAPDSTRAILTRVLFNLRRSYERRDLVEEALAALDCAEALEPGEPSFLRERGLLLLKAGRSEEAIRALEAYVSAASGEDRDAVTKLIDIVREQALPSEGAELVSGTPAQTRIFTFEEACLLLPKVQEITSEAVLRYARMGEAGGESENERQGIVREWAREILALGAVIKGLWLVDFDSGAGYYCWKYPEPSLEYFHGYEEGFAGRLPLQ
ncbi:MAG: tetratricopeptide repeat protein [Acidobacteriota bacterium]|nr:tetratricopeptide repeat protein [Acidobacteriota bacterium]